MPGWRFMSVPLLYTDGAKCYLAKSSCFREANISLHPDISSVHSITGLIPVEMNGTTPTYCSVYGDLRVIAVRICATDVFDSRSEEMAVVLCESFIVSKLIACETNGIVLQPDLTCQDPETWPEISVRVRIWKQYADILYTPPPQPIILQLTRVSGKLNTTYISALSYRTFYDALLPEGLPDLKTNEYFLLVAFGSTAYERNLDLLPLLAKLPWRVGLRRDFQGLNISDENMIKAMTCETVERIKLAFYSLWTFVGSSGVISIWCVARLYQSALTKKPPLAPFAELDLAIKLVISADSRGKAIFDGLTELSVSAFTKELSNVRLQIIGPRDDFEMQPLPQCIMRRIKEIGRNLGRPKRRTIRNDLIN